jgi:hypothetical protein
MSSTQHSTSGAAPGPALTVERVDLPGTGFVRYRACVGPRLVGIHSVPCDCDHADLVALIEAFYDRHLEAGVTTPPHLGPHRNALMPAAGVSTGYPLRLVP